MKKTLLVLAAAAALVFGLASCNTPSNSGAGDAGGTGKTQPVVASLTSATLQDNVASGNNYQAVIEMFDSTNTYVCKKGDKITVSMKVTPDNDVSKFKAFLVDNTADAGWWNVLTGFVEGCEGVKGTEATLTLAFEATADSTSAQPGACKLGLYADDLTKDKVTNLTIKDFSVKVE